MKNLDIEKLERKTPYTLPENFFSEMQANVLDKTIHAQKSQDSKIFKLNFRWAAAATILLIAALGILFFTFNNKARQERTITENIHRTKLDDSTQALAVNSANSTVEKTEATTAYQTLKQDIASAEKAEPKPFQKITENTVKNMKKNTANTYGKTEKSKPDLADNQYTGKTENQEKMVENVLASFSQDDLKQLSKNTEQDVYLDLY